MYPWRSDTRYQPPLPQVWPRDLRRYRDTDMVEGCRANSTAIAGCGFVARPGQPWHRSQTEIAHEMVWVGMLVDGTAVLVLVARAYRWLRPSAARAYRWHWAG